MKPRSYGQRRIHGKDVRGAMICAQQSTEYGCPPPERVEHILLSAGIDPSVFSLQGQTGNVAARQHE
jgi:hypothetical protein